MVALDEIAGVTGKGVRRGPGQPARFPGSQHRGRDARQLLHALILGGDDLELAGIGRQVEVGHPVVLFLVGRPHVPAQAQLEGQARMHLPTVVEVQPGLLLLEVEVAAVVLVRQVGGQPHQHAAESDAGEGGEVVVLDVVQRRPVAVEIVRSVGLLQLPDVVVLVAKFAAEPDRVPPADPGDVVLGLVRGQHLILAVVGVPAAPVEERAVGADGGPSPGPEGVGQTQFLGPVGIVGQRSRALGSTISGHLQLVQEGGPENAVPADEARVQPGIVAARAAGVAASGLGVAEPAAKQFVGVRGAGEPAREVVLAGKDVVHFRRQVAHVRGVRVVGDKVGPQKRIHGAGGFGRHAAHGAGELGNTVRGNPPVGEGNACPVRSC